MSHMAFRARSPQALERRVAALKGSGYEIGWTDGDLGHGPAFAFHDPDGHEVEIYYETEWYKAPPELQPGAEKSGHALPCPRRQRAAARSSQLPRGRHQGQPHFLPGLSGLPAHRADRDERRHGSGHVADGLQQEL